jgi:hypothetical protein
MRRSRPTATLTCRRPPATEAHCAFATVIALSSSDMAPREERYIGDKGLEVRPSLMRKAVIDCSLLTWCIGFRAVLAALG